MEIAALRSVTWIGSRFGVVRPGGDSSNLANSGRGLHAGRVVGLGLTLGILSMSMFLGLETPPADHRLGIILYAV